MAAWWYAAAKREMDREIWTFGPGAPQRMTVTRLAEVVGDIPPNVSRCLSGEIPTIRLVTAISDALRIPRPVFFPQTEQEALAIHGALSLVAVRSDVARAGEYVADLEGASESSPGKRGHPATGSRAKRGL